MESAGLLDYLNTKLVREESRRMGAAIDGLATFWRTFGECMRRQLDPYRTQMQSARQRVRRLEHEVRTIQAEVDRRSRERQQHQ